MRNIIIFISTALIFIFISNNWILVSKHSISIGRPLETPIKILQISDLHNKTFSFNQSSLVSAIEKNKPDIIVMTGDLLDSRKPDPKAVYTLLDTLNTDADLYYVTGNHEYRLPIYSEFRDQLTNYGVHILDNKAIQLNESITLVGIHDFSFHGGYANYIHVLKTLKVNENQFSILLSHRPEHFDLYASHNYNMILTGHAHGGQFRIPLLGGLIAPNQGLFPEYTAGIHEINQSKMIVSRGLGNSIIPIRLFNQPELVLVTLK